MTEWIISASALIVVVVLVRQLLKGRLSLRLQYALWALVLVRLLAPFSLGGSRFSVQNAVEARESVQTGLTLTIPPNKATSPWQPDLAPSITQTVDEQGNIHYVEDMEQWQEDMDRAWQEYKAENTKQVSLPAAEIFRAIWIVGMAGMAAVLLASNLRFWGRLRRSRQVLDYMPLPVYVTGAVETPCLFGLFKPAVYVTPEVAADETAMGHVLAHEQTHYCHRDHIWAVLRCVCLVVHWYNPLVWLAAALSRRDGELACDEGAIRRIGEEHRAAYGRTLIGLTCAGKGGLLHTATTMTGSKTGIKERIRLIAQKPKMKVYTLIAVLLIALIAVGCTFTGKKFDFPSWAATITVDDLDNKVEDDDSDSEAYLSGNDRTYTMRVEEREELLSILQGIERKDFQSKDPGLTEYPYALTIRGSAHGGLQTDPWWLFQCLEGGMLKVSCRSSDLAFLYGFDDEQWLDCPELYSFIIQTVNETAGTVAQDDEPAGLDTPSTPSDGLYNITKRGDTVSLTLYTAEQGARDTFAFVYNSDPWRLTNQLIGTQWTLLSGAPEELGDYWLTYTSEDGSVAVTFYSGENGPVKYEDGEHTVWWQVRPNFWNGRSNAEDLRTGVYDALEVDWQSIAPFPADTAKKAVEKFAAEVYGEHLKNTTPGSTYHVLDYEVLSWSVREVSTDGNAAVGSMRYAVLPEDYDSSGFWVGNTVEGAGEYEGWLEMSHEFLLEWQEDGLWHCVTMGTGGVRLENYGYENGLWSAVYGSSQTYRWEGDDPYEAAVTLITAYVEDLMVPDEMRTFTVTDYRNIEVLVVPTLEMSEADRSAYNYGLKDWEIGENCWIVEFNMEFRWTGVLDDPPAGSGEYLPEGMWLNQTGQGSPSGFLLTREGDEFVLRSRYPDRH